MRDFADCITPLAIEQIDETRTAPFHKAMWRDSPSVCALADDLRHLGHIVRAGNCWLAFDATRFNKTRSGFWLLGSCVDIAAAKCAVELAVVEESGQLISRVH